MEDCRWVRFISSYHIRYTWCRQLTAKDSMQDLEQESQRRAQEGDALEQQLSKAASDTWPCQISQDLNF
jgi:hypothetical protein